MKTPEPFWIVSYLPRELWEDTQACAAAMTMMWNEKLAECEGVRAPGAGDLRIEAAGYFRYAEINGDGEMELVPVFPRTTEPGHGTYTIVAVRATGPAFRVQGEVDDGE